MEKVQLIDGHPAVTLIGPADPHINPQAIVFRFLDDFDEPVGPLFSMTDLTFERLGLVIASVGDVEPPKIKEGGP